MSEQSTTDAGQAAYDAAYKAGRQQAATFYNSVARALGTNPEAVIEVLENRQEMCHAAMRDLSENSSLCDMPDTEYHAYWANDGMIGRLMEIVVHIESGVLV